MSIKHYVKFALFLSLIDYLLIWKLEVAVVFIDMRKLCKIIENTSRTESNQYFEFNIMIWRTTLDSRYDKLDLNL